MINGQILRLIQWVFALASVLMLVSGVYLVFLYRPPGLAAFEGGDAILDVMRPVHQAASGLWLALSVVLVIAEGARRSIRRGVTFGVLAGLGVVAIATGLQLPWDQLALDSIAAGSSIYGYVPLFEDNTLFALVDGVEVTTSTLQRRFLIHLAIGIPCVVFAALIAIQTEPQSLDSDSGSVDSGSLGLGALEPEPAEDD